MKRIHIVLINLIVGLTVCLRTSDVMAQILIDDYSEGAFSIQGTGGGLPVRSSQTGSEEHLLGGKREVTLLQSNSFEGLSTASLEVGDGYLEYTRKKNDIQIAYGQYIVSGPTALDIDMTTGGADQFALTLAEAPSQFTITLYVLDNSAQPNSWAIFTQGNGAGTYYFPYSHLPPSMDLTRIGGLRIAVQTPTVNGPGVFRLANLAAVPESQSYGLVCAGTLLLLATGKRCFRRKFMRELAAR